MFFSAVHATLLISLLNIKSSSIHVHLPVNVSDDLFRTADCPTGTSITRPLTPGHVQNNHDRPQTSNKITNRNFLSPQFESSVSLEEPSDRTHSSTNNRYRTNDLQYDGNNMNECTPKHQLTMCTCSSASTVQTVQIPTPFRMRKGWGIRVD